MAVLANSEGSSKVPPEIQQHLEVDDDYNKYTPSADYNSASGRIFRNKKFTKKRHESKTRRTEEYPSNVCGSDEDYPQSTRPVDDMQLQHRSIPKIMLSINQTIKKMTIKDNAGPFSGSDTFPTVTGEGTLLSNSNVAEDHSVIVEAEKALEQQNPNNTTPSSCNLQAQGKRRRHRRKQQYKRMAVDVLNDKKCLQLKIPTSNSSEDSGIGKRKRNIIVTDTHDPTGNVNNGAVAVGVPVAVSNFSGKSIPQQLQQPWQIDDNDAVMMDCDDMESSITKFAGSQNSQGILITEDESGESDTQNDDIESLSDHNQDADDEESDYYNNDSSTTSLSESSFTLLNPSKKFIPVHSREIRSGRRRLKNTNLTSIENEELSKFLQNPNEIILKVCPSSEKERQDFVNVASLYSLSYEEACDQDERVWIQLTKTPQTTTQRRNDLIKAGDRSSFNNFSDGSSLAPLFDTIVSEKVERGESDDCIEESTSGAGNKNLCRSGVGLNQLVNSKRIKKGC